jgi:putative tryptophan/tyrosine transport system ATP-binding protein
MINIADLSVLFNKGTSFEVKALHSVDLTIESGEFLIVVGANGSGKSTLLNAIAGSISSNSGSIKIDGTDVTHEEEFKRTKWISRIFQNPLNGTASDMSIIDNFRLAALRTKKKKLSIGINTDFINRVKERISLLNMGLENKLDLLMGSLSGGQRQALTLIMAIMDENKIILLDEPAAALDPRSSGLLMQHADRIIKEFRLTALLVTHNLKDAHQYGTRIIQMNEGVFVRDLSMESKTKLQLQDIYQWFS